MNKHFEKLKNDILLSIKKFFSRFNYHEKIT